MAVSYTHLDVYKRQHCSAGAAYDYFCDEMENCLPFVFGCTREIRDLAVDAADEKLSLIHIWRGCAPDLR